jgi:hypothetical protein
LACVPAKTPGQGIVQRVAASIAGAARSVALVFGIRAGVDKALRTSRITPQGTDSLTDLGIRGLKIRGNRLDEEWRERLKGRRKFKVYREMADTDVTCGGYLSTLQLFLGQAPFSPTPATDDAGAELPGADAVAKFVAECWGDTDMPSREIIQEIILHAARDGAAPIEKTYKLRHGDHPEDPTIDSRYNDGRFGWRSFGIRPLESIESYNFDDNYNVIDFIQMAETDYRTRTIPAWKIQSFRFRGSKNSPEGISMLSIAERAYYFKSNFEEIEAIGIKRELAGMPVMEAPQAILSPGADAKALATRQQLQDLVSLVDADQLAGVVVPASETKDGKTGFKFSLMASGGSRAIDVGAVIKRLETRIAVGLGAAFMYTGVDGIGARSLDESKKDSFKLACLTILGTIAETIELMSNELCKLNGFPQELWPKWKHEDINAKDLAAFASFVSSLGNAGMLTYTEETEAYIREYGDLPAKTGGGVPRLLASPADAEEPTL